MKKRIYYKSYLKIISLAIAIIMILMSLPIQAIALSLSEDATVQEQATDIETMSEEVFVLAEDVTKRGEFEKHFYCSDGTFMAVTYPEAVHYLDDNNQWAEVDNSLLFNSNKGAYEVENGNFNVAFYDGQRMDAGDMLATTDVTLSNQSNEKLVSLKNGDSSLSWTLIASKEVNNNVISSNNISSLNPTIDDQANILTISSSASANVLGSTSKKTGNTTFEKINIRDEAAFNVTAMSNQVEYDSLFGENEGITVRYTIYHNRIEEDIFIEKKTDIKSFSMSVECEGLTPMLRNDNSVDFLDVNGEMVYHVSSPYTIDAAYSVSNDVDVALSVTNGKCIITYTPDDEWMNSSDRVYPIMLDPSVTTNGYTANIKDTYVEEGSVVNHSSEQFLYVGTNGNKKRAIILSIDSLPEIIGEYPILYASLNFNLIFNAERQTTVYMDLISDEYSVETATYSSYMYATKSGTEVSHVFEGDLSFCFSLTKYLYRIYNKEINNVFAIYLDNLNNDTFRSIYSSEAPYSQGPNLVINYGYKLPDGLDDGEIISIKTFSNFYLHINNSSADDGTNIIGQQAQILTDYNKFIIDKDENTGGYVLQTVVNGSWGVLTATDTGNVELSSQYLPEAQEWLISPINSTFFRIVLSSNPNIMLTMDILQGDGNNIVVTEDVSSEVDNPSGWLYQMWNIYVDDSLLTVEYETHCVNTGVYFISDNYGSFLSQKNDSLIDYDVNNLGNYDESIRWVITHLSSNEYTIQSYTDLSLYLKCDTNGNISLMQASSATELSNDIIWYINIFESEYDDDAHLRVIQNKQTGHYLYVNNEIACGSLTISYDYNFVWILGEILPTSGGEKRFSPSFWGNYINKANCYYYAINYSGSDSTNLMDHQPGVLAGDPIVHYVTSDNILERVNCDADFVGFRFKRIGKYEVCSPDAYKVALVLDEGVDYHWYRQNIDGTWSHKRGHSAISLYDDNQQYIGDPEYIDRDYSDSGGANYDIFVGFFEVTPLSETP